MNEPLQASLLGIVEGVTEFLPISSTGHLIVASSLLGFQDSGGTFEIVIQLGAVLAVVWFYRHDLWSRLRATPSNLAVGRFWLSVIVACLPAAVLGFALQEFITRVLFSPMVVAFSLILGGLVLGWVDRPRPIETDNPDPSPPVASGLDAIRPTQALLIGLAQTVALIPGVSRSGSSIVGGLLTGLDRPTATAFSFYLAIPVLGGATLFKLLQNLRQIMASGQLGIFAIGLGVAFITALLTVRWLLRYVSRHDFRLFALYRILAGLLILVWANLKTFLSS